MKEVGCDGGYQKGDAGRSLSELQHRACHRAVGSCPYSGIPLAKRFSRMGAPYYFERAGFDFLPDLGGSLYPVQMGLLALEVKR